MAKMASSNEKVFNCISSSDKNQAQPSENQKRQLFENKKAQPRRKAPSRPNLPSPLYTIAKRSLSPLSQMTHATRLIHLATMTHRTQLNLFVIMFSFVLMSKYELTNKRKYVTLR